MTARGKWARALVVALLVALVLGRWLAVTTAHSLWADSLGAGETHAQIARLRVMLFGTAFVAATLWSLGNLYFVFRTIRSVHVPRRVGNIEILEVVPRRYLGVGVVVLGVVVALLLSYGANDWWYTRLLASGSTELGVTEPILGRDLSYYLFHLPWQRTLLGFSTLATSTVLAVTAVLYGAMGALRWAGRRLRVNDLARAHLGALLVAFGLVLFWGYRLEPAEYVAGVHNVRFDSIFLDVRLPVARLLMWLALVAAGASMLWIWVSRMSIVLTAWSILLLVSLVGHYAVPTFAGAVRSREELSVDYLERAGREFRSLAFGVPEVSTSIALPAMPDAEELIQHADELATAAVWDAFAINVFLNRSVADPPEWRFSRAKLGLYRNGEDSAVPLFLAGRRVDLTEASRIGGDLSWEQIHVEPYAYASGAVALQATGVSEDRFPLFVPDLATPDSVSSSMSEVTLRRPDVVFSPGAGEYAIVNQGDVHRSGVVARSLWRRVALAWALQSLPIIGSREVRDGATILWNRDIAERLSALVPFAVFSEAYPVIVDDRLIWLASGYVYSEEAPLSPRVQWRGRSVGYVRAGLIGVVDAWSGEASVFLSPWSDPLTETWSELLPGLIQPTEDLAPELREHLQFPVELFDLQVRLLDRVDPDVAPERRGLAGRRGLQGTAPGSATTFWWFGTGLSDSVPRLRLRAAFEEGQPPFLAGIAEAWVHRGVPRVETFSLERPLTIPGPSQIATRLSNARLSTMAVPGPIKVVPFTEGVLFLQASYDESDPTRRPQLADVVVAWGDIVEGGPGVSDAVARVLQVRPNSDRASGTWREARRWFERLDEARRRGDWNAFGEAYENLKRLLTSHGDSVP